MKLICFMSVVIVIMHRQIDTVRGSCNSTLDKVLFDDLLNMMLKIKGSGEQKTTDKDHHVNQKKDIPAFSASLTATQSLSDKETVKFNKVWTSIGNGYNPNTGIFTAPEAGVYYFAFTGMSAASQTLFVHLWHNNQKTTGLYINGTNYNVGTVNMVLKLEKGDQVSIKSSTSGQSIFSNEQIYNSFSGYLISE